MIWSMGQRVCLAVIGGMLLWSVPVSAGNSGETDLRMRGQANAPVTLIEYSDFTCGFCLKFFKQTWPRIQARYVDTGKVRFVYRDFPRGDQGTGLDAATAARCAGEQGQYWGMHDRLFSEGGQLDKQVYRRHAATLSLDQAAFERCMSDGRFTRTARKPISGGFMEPPGSSWCGRRRSRRKRNRPWLFLVHFPSRCSRKRSIDCWRTVKNSSSVRLNNVG